MSSKEFLLLKAAVYEMGLLFNQQPNDERITAYAKALSGFTPDQIRFAFNHVIRSGSAFFPSLAEILKFLTPSQAKTEDRAPVIVAEMLQLIRDFSEYNESKMLAVASADARIAFEALGSTRDIRMSENIETTKAQLERLVKGALRSKEAEVHMGKLLQLGIRPTQSASDNSLRRLGYEASVGRSEQDFPAALGETIPRTEIINP